MGELKSVAEVYHTEKRGDLIYRCFFGELVFSVVRFDNGVSVLVTQPNSQEVLSELATWIAPWASNVPERGDAYYWYWDGLNHSTPPIAPKTTD